MSGTRAASLAFSRGTTTCSIFKSFNPETIGKMPFMVLKEPSNDNSPRNAVFLIKFSSTMPSRAKIPTAMGKSYIEPSFLISAGARLITTFWLGNENPEFLIAERTLSFASDTAASGNPTIITAGMDCTKSTSTVILYASRPITVDVMTCATITGSILA